jgi:hypothetical protein
VLIVLLMLAASLALWVGNPVLWMFVTSRLQAGTQPSMGPYALALGGVIGGSVLLAKLLSHLNRLYTEVTGTAPTVRIIVPWRRSVRGEAGPDEDAKLPVSLLDVFMVISVLVAVIALVTWFVIVKPLPPGLPGGAGGAKH